MAIIVIALIIVSSVAAYAVIQNGSPRPTAAQRLALDSADLGADWTVDPDTSLGTPSTAVPPISSQASYDINNGTLCLYMTVAVYNSESDCLAAYEKFNISMTTDPSFHHSVIPIGDRGFLFWNNGANYSDSYPNIIFLKGNAECIFGFWGIGPGPAISPHHDWDLSAIMMLADLQASKISDP
jgi:hypothetical protein